MIRETDLYLPVKAFLEEKGFVVKSEVKGCDVVAIKESQMIIVELKKSFSLDLVLQGIDRKSFTDHVYVGILRPKTLKGSRWNKILKLCKMLSLGLIIVSLRGEKSLVEVALDPVKYTPNHNGKKKRAIETEFNDRITDFNLGGSSKVPLVTAYKEDVLVVALTLREKGALPLKDIKTLTKIEKSGQILRSNVYNWFERVEKGVYDLTAKGHKALEDHKHVLDYLAQGNSEGD